MKPTLCRQCIIYPSCTKSCIPHANEWHDLYHQMCKMKRFIYSNNMRTRKHVKEQHMKHYNSLMTKFNRCGEDGTRVRARHDKKNFVGHFSGEMLHGVELLRIDIDKLIIEKIIEDAQK